MCVVESCWESKEKQTAFFCYSYFFSVSTVIVSLVPVKRQLPFAGEGMLPEHSRCLIPNYFLWQDLKALSAAGGSHHLSRPGPASQIKAIRLLPVVNKHRFSWHYRVTSENAQSMSDENLISYRL